MDSLIVSNMTRRPTRTITSILGIAVGVVMIVISAGLARGMMRNSGQRDSNVNAEILFQPPGGFGAMVATTPLSLPVAYAAAVAAVPGVRAVTPVGRYVRSGADPGSTAIGFEWIEGIAEEPTAQYASYPQITGLRIVTGRMPAADDEVVVDFRRAGEPGRGMGTHVELLGRPFTVVGVYEPEVGSRIKMRLSTMQKLLGSRDNCSWLLVKVVSPNDQQLVARRILEKFPGNSLVFTRDIPAFYDRGTPTLNAFLDVIVGLATVITALNILLSMHTAVTERTHEIGILKSLGASRVFIVRAVEQEALVISALGVAVGLLLALATRASIMGSTALLVQIEPRWIGIAAAVGLLGGAAGALYPALRAASADPIKALAHE